MLEFIINTDSIENTLMILAVINGITCMFLDTAKGNNKKYDEKTSFKNIVADIYSSILLIILVIMYLKYPNMYALITICALLFYLIFIYNNIFNKKMKFTMRDKGLYSAACMLIPCFFSSEMYHNYANIFSFLSHTQKELFFIIFLNLKIIIFIFMFLINISVLTSNIKIILNKNIPKNKKMINNINSINIYNGPYDFALSRKYKSKKYYTIDKIIYFISFPFYLIWYILCEIIKQSIIRIVNLFYNIFKISSDFDDNRKTIIELIIKISFIISLSFVYCITIYNKQIFSNETISLYELLTTVILIPLIYDSIKKKNFL